MVFVDFPLLAGVREREKLRWELEKILAAEDNLLLTGFVIGV